MGGTFDPIHRGHIDMAQMALKELALDEVLFIPDGDPPHKCHLAPATDRLAMVRLAMAHRPGFRVSEMEVHRSGTTYTVDTLAQLTQERPGCQLSYIVGADTLMVIETWRDFPRVASMLSSLFCVPRPGIDEAHLHKQEKRIERNYGVRVVRSSRSGLDISSTAVRAAAARYQPLAALVPDEVAEYISQRRLYRVPMLDALHAALSPERYLHTLGVEECAVKLACRYGVDVEKARIAALLHDCARGLTLEDVRALLGVEAGEMALLHAPAGALLARDRYGISDPEILSAIRWHTTGRAHMTPLDKVIYLADFIEPHRKPYDGLELLREAAGMDLDRAVCLAARGALDYVRQRGLSPDRHTLEMLADKIDMEEFA